MTPPPQVYVGDPGRWALEEHSRFHQSFACCAKYNLAEATRLENNGFSTGLVWRLNKSSWAHLISWIGWDENWNWPPEINFVCESYNEKKSYWKNEMLRIDQIVCMYHCSFRCASVSGSCSAFTFKLLDVNHFWRCFRGSHILTNTVVVWGSVLEELGQSLSSLSVHFFPGPPYCKRVWRGK